MKKLLAVFLAVTLVAVLLLPSVTLGGKAGGTLDGVEIVKKVAAKGPWQAGALARDWGSKPFVVSGYIGEPVQGDRYAIVIGISDYPGTGHVLEGGMDLSYADDDAYAVQSMLLAQGFGNENIYLFVDAGASRAAILSQIAALKEIVTRDDEVVFYFSGHAAKYSARPLASKGGGKVGIVTWGYEDLPNGITYPEVIWDSELDRAFKGFATDRIIFGFDCCLAGSFGELGGKGRIVVMATTVNGIAGEYGEDYESVGAIEIPDIGWINQGLFTFFFAVYGLTYGLADFYPADGVATVEEAFDFARAILVGWTAANPELNEIPTIRDGFRGDLDL